MEKNTKNFNSKKPIIDQQQQRECIKYCRDVFGKGRKNEEEEKREFAIYLREDIEKKRAKEKEQREQREKELLLQLDEQMQLIRLADQMQREHIKKMEFNAVIGIMIAVFSFLMLLVLFLKYC